MNKTIATGNTDKSHKHNVEKKWPETKRIHTVQLHSYKIQKRQN